jgi:hypothetical protein
MDANVRSVREEFIQECHGDSLSPPIHEMPAPASLRYLGDHGKKGRDTNPPGDEQIFVRIGQGEVIARAAHLYQVARPQPLMHVGRTATTILFLQNGESPAIPVCQRAAQGVLAFQLRPPLSVNVRAGGPARQGPAIGAFQLQRQDTLGLPGDGSDPELDEAVVVRRECRRQCKPPFAAGLALWPAAAEGCSPIPRWLWSYQQCTEGLSQRKHGFHLMKCLWSLPSSPDGPGESVRAVLDPAFETVALDGQPPIADIGRAG